jgi:deazaflavin-dependent oxidoreductase (nitroreductase family)
MENQRQTPFYLKPAEWVIGSRYGGPIFIKIATPIDRWLIPATNGRLSVLVGQPILVLEMKGAKSGKPRRIPLVYMMDGDRVILVASFVGKPRNPAWYHNLKANPLVKLFLKGRTGNYTAEEATGVERERLWADVTAFYGGYAKYQERTGGRVIPLMILTPEAKAT